MCECYQIGGKFVAEDPDCPKHGWAAQQEDKQREYEEKQKDDRITELENRIAKLEFLVCEFDGKSK